MTEASPGPGWWQANDGRWYPPHLHPSAGTDAPSTPPAPPSTPPAPPSTPPAPGAEVTATHEPIDWERVAAEREHRRKQSERTRRLRIGAAVVVALALLGALVLFAQNDDDGGGTATTDESDEPGGSNNGDPGDGVTVAPESTTVTTSPPASDAPTSGPDTTPATTAPPATAPATAPTSAPATTAPTNVVSVFDLQPGMCIDNAGLSSGLVTDLQAVGCDQPHSHEVYQRITYVPTDGAYDATRITTFANEQCAQSFATYVGISYDRSKYYFLHLAPSEESWTDQGDRDIVCLLFLQGSTMTGSAQGTAQ